MSIKEISLSQALVAVLCEAKESGSDITSICEKAKVGITGNKIYRTVEQSYVMSTIEEIEKAYQEANKA
ncbi:MAG: hypothetical protein P1U57_07710 [Oleibacter sp.]|nr:hypothetical protein [Thalassolituus sp.]